ncbi:MAG: uracil-DNA glycosylase [Ignavibacteriota bacterium]
MARTKNEILTDIEIWAKDRLLNGEETIYLSGEAVKGDRVKVEGNENINIEMKKEIKSQKVETLTRPKITAAISQTLPPSTSDLKPFSEEWKSATDLPTLQSMISGCTKCELHKTRTNFVFGVGNPNAKVMVIGEAPGKDEDEKGEPFVGRAGQLLDKMLIAINFPREEVFIANILKSRPPGNRDPKPEEVEACEPYLFKQIEIIKPKMILCVGRIAGNNLLKMETEALKDMRGKTFDFMGAKVVVTYHPAALLRNSSWKPAAWEDLQRFRKLYDEMEGTA